MEDISLENTKAHLRELDYVEQEDGSFLKTARMAKTPGVGMLPASRATITGTVVTTYVGHVGNGAAGYIPLDPKDYHRTYTTAFQ